MGSSNGWQSAEVTNNPRHLVRGAASIRANVHQNQDTIEILIHDLDAPRDERWTSIIFSRRTGDTGIGRHRDPREAWKLAVSEEAKERLA